MRVVLASKSPRRQELLKMIYNDFEIYPSNVREWLPQSIESGHAAGFLAAQKACDVSQQSGADIVIGCDTVVVCENEILGKPKNRADAYIMLKKLSGKTHIVYTGVCVVSKMGDFAFTEATKVTFDEMTNDEINDYLNRENVMDKAGAYAIQGLAGKFISKIDGDYYNVVGLPVSRLYKELKRHKLV